jgi:hypothetical protein
VFEIKFNNFYREKLPSSIIPLPVFSAKEFALNPLNLSIGIPDIANNRQFSFGKKAVNLKSSK